MHDVQFEAYLKRKNKTKQKQKAKNKKQKKQQTTNNKKQKTKNKEQNKTKQILKSFRFLDTDVSTENPSHGDFFHTEHIISTKYRTFTKVSLVSS